MNINTNIEIVSLENANKLFKQHKNNLKACGISLVKDTRDKRKIGKSFSRFRGPKYQTLLRDIKKFKCMVNYKDYEIPSIENLKHYLYFIDVLKPLDIELLIIHCRRGVSRSAAFAVATIAYVHNISIKQATILARNYKKSKVNGNCVSITPNSVILNQFEIILKERNFNIN